MRFSKKNGTIVGLVCIVGLTVLISTLPVPQMAFNNGAGSADREYSCGGTSCHDDPTEQSASTVSMIASKLNPNTGEQITVTVTVAGAEASGSPLGVFLLRSQTITNSQPSVDGWVIVSDPSGVTTFNYYEEPSVTGGVVWTWTLNAPPIPGIYNLYASEHHGTGDRYWQDDTVGLTFTVTAPPNNPPEAQDLTVQGFAEATSGIMHITDHTPDLGWSFYDPDVADTQQQYDVRVGTASGLSDMWTLGPQPGAAVSVTYAGLALQDGVNYWFGIRVYDGTDWSVWNETQFHMNSLPEAQSLTVKGFADGTTSIIHITDHTPDLGWSFYDPDVADTQQQYDVRIGTASGLSDMWALGPQAGAATTETYAGIALVDGTDYWFGARVYDGYEWSSWNETQFHMNSLPPTAVPPISPADDALIPSSPAQTLSWTPGGADTEGDTVTYYWYADIDNPPAAPYLANDSTTGTSSTSFATSPSTDYYWYVNATDGWEWNSTIVWNFTTSAVVNNPPEAQDLTVQGFAEATTGIMHITDHTPDLNWTFYDPDGGDIQQQYEVRVGTSSGLADMWSPGAQPGATISVVYAGTPLLDGVDYWYGISVYDGNTWSNWNETQFHMNTIKAQSLTVQGFAEGTVEIMHIAIHTPDLGWLFFDPEVGDAQQEYELRVGTSSGFSDMWSPGPQPGAASTETYAGIALMDSADYWFGARLYDGYEWSNWNETQFHMNSIPPTAVPPISPADDALIPSSPAQTLSWTSGGADTEGDTVTYYWYVDVDNPPAAPYLANGSATGTSSTSFPTSPSTDYYWYVNATDSWEWNSTIVWNFTTSAFVNSPPESHDLTVQGFAEATTGIMHITDHTPDLGWTFYDPDGGDTQQQYEVRVGTSSGLSDMWLPGAQASAATSVTYGGAPLLDGVDYWFGIRVYDGADWGNWNETQFHMNSPPTLDWVGGAGYGSDGLEPESGNTSTSFNFKIMYIDAENDSPTGGEPKLHIKSGGAEISGSPFTMSYVSGSYSAGATYSYSTTLAKGTDYSYYFTASDDQGETAIPTGEKDAPDVTVRDVTPPSPPTNITVTTPDERGKLAISWDANIEDDLAGYRIYRSNTSSSSTEGSGYKLIGIVDASVTSFTDTNLDDERTYYYMITAFDTNGNESPYSEEASGTTNTAPVPEPEADFLWLMWLIIVLILVIIIEIVILLTWKQRREKEPLGKEQPLPPPPSTQLVKPEEPRKTCIKCGKELEPSYKLCPYCGTEQGAETEKNQPTVCTNCGKALSPEYKLCPYCGNPK